MVRNAPKLVRNVQPLAQSLRDVKNSAANAHVATRAYRETHLCTTHDYILLEGYFLGLQHEATHSSEADTHLDAFVDPTNREGH